MRVATGSEYFRSSLEDRIYDFTRNGECTGCGNCCTNLLPMNGKEIKEIRRYIKKHHIQECKHNIPLAKASFDMVCPFLDMGAGDRKCVIYQVRPMICREFICNNEKRAKLTRREINKSRKAVDVREVFFRG